MLCCRTLYDKPCSNPCRYWSVCPTRLGKLTGRERRSMGKGVDPQRLAGLGLPARMLSTPIMERPGEPTDPP